MRSPHPSLSTADGSSLAADWARGDRRDRPEAGAGGPHRRERDVLLGERVLAREVTKVIGGEKQPRPERDERNGGNVAAGRLVHGMEAARTSDAAAMERRDE